MTIRYNPIKLSGYSRRYVSFEMKQNSPNYVDELVVYAATLADYLTRLKNQGNAVEQLGLAMVEVFHHSLYFIL